MTSSDAFSVLDRSMFGREIQPHILMWFNEEVRRMPRVSPWEAWGMVAKVQQLHYLIWVTIGARNAVNGHLMVFDFCQSTPAGVFRGYEAGEHSHARLIPTITLYADLQEGKPSREAIEQCLRATPKQLSFLPEGTRFNDWWTPAAPVAKGLLEYFKTSRPRGPF